MRHIVPLACRSLASLCLAGIIQLSGIVGASAAASEVAARQNLEKVMATHKVKGTFVVLDVTRDKWIIAHPDRAAKRFYPASTFKIANSLIALETGAIRDENQIIPYGGQPQRIKRWEQDMSIRQAIRISNVPVFQTIARRVGRKHYGSWLKTLAYGNARIGTGLTTFWLKGPLKISAVEQAVFLSALARKKLPLSTRSQTIVRDIIKLETKGKRTLFGKTGWAARPSPQIGWFVGWVETEKGLFTFAFNMDIHTRKDVHKRRAVAEKLLGALQLY